jgi:hypothetical protein
LVQGFRQGPRRQRVGEEAFDGVHARRDAFRAVDDDDRDADGPCLALDRLGEGAVKVPRPAGHDALLQPCALELRRGYQPSGARTIPHSGRRQRRPVGDDERRARQRVEVVDDHRTALAVE